jgi:hypothetical protein
MFGNKKNLDSIYYSVQIFQKQIRFFSSFILESQTIQTYFSILFAS